MFEIFTIVVISAIVGILSYGAGAEAVRKDICEQLNGRYIAKTCYENVKELPILQEKKK